jgi:cell wall-associated NlpC family hydrolase
MGLDCSGFVQMVLMEAGLSPPRDAHDQWRAARRVGRGLRRRPGDLVFFGARRGRVGHVGILLDPSTYAHARGVVRVNSLDPGNELYDSELAATVRGFGRLSKRAPPAP